MAVTARAAAIIYWRKRGGREEGGLRRIEPFRNGGAAGIIIGAYYIYIYILIIIILLLSYS